MSKQGNDNLDTIYARIEKLAHSSNMEDRLQLISFFGHPVWAVRKRAAELMSRHGEGAVPALTQTVFLDQNVDTDTLYWCIRCAGDIGGSAVKGVLIPMLRQERLPDNYKSYVIRSMAGNQDPEIIQILIGLLGDPSWAIRREAAEVLQECGDQALPAIKKAFSSGNEDIRYWAVKILGHVLGAEAVEYFHNLLRSKTKETRYYAATALGEIDTPEAMKSLSELFSDESWLVRAQVAEIFERKGREAIPYLRSIFEKGNSDARFQTIRLMGKISGREARSFIEKILHSKETEMKFYAITALAENADNEGIETLIGCFTDNVWLVRKHASEALSRMGHLVLEKMERFLMDSRDENARYWAIVTLSQMGADGAATIVRHFTVLEKKEKKVALSQLNELSSPDTMELLFTSLDDREWPVRSEAARILGNFIPETARFFPERWLKGSNDARHWLCQLAAEHGSVLAPVLQTLLAETTGEDPDSLHLRLSTRILLFGTGTPEAHVSMINLLVQEDELEFFIDSLSSKPIHSGLFRILAECFTDPNYPQGINFEPLIRVHLQNHAPVIRELAGRDCSRYGLFIDMGAETSDDQSLKFLQQFFNSESLDVKNKVFQYIAQSSSLDALTLLLDHFRQCDDNERLLIISTRVKQIDRTGIKNIVDRFRILGDSDSRWLARLLVEWAAEQQNQFELLLATTSDPKVKHWLDRILKHLNGTEFLT